MGNVAGILATDKLKIMKIDAKLIFQNLVIFILASIILLYVFRPSQKREIFSRLKNGKYTTGKYLKDEPAFRGGDVAVYQYKVNNKLYRESRSKASFNDIEPKFGRYYFVKFDENNPSNSLLMFNLPVPDSLLSNYKNNSSSRLPIPEYQRIDDSITLLSLTSGIGEYFPPYYDKEELSELEYLMEDWED